MSFSGSSVSNTNPYGIFDMPIFKPIVNLGPDKCLELSIPSVLGANRE